MQSKANKSNQKQANKCKTLEKHAMPSNSKRKQAKAIRSKQQQAKASKTLQKHTQTCEAYKKMQKQAKAIKAKRVWKSN